MLDSVLGHGTEIQRWFSDNFLELNIMGGDFGATSDISVVAALRLRKGLCLGHKCGIVVAHRLLLLEGTSLWQQVNLLP